MYSSVIAVLLLIISLTLGIGILVIVKNPRSIINQSFCVFLLGIILIEAGFIFLHAHYAFCLYDKLIHYGGALFMPGLLCFASTFPDKARFPRHTWPLYIPCVSLFVLIPFNVLIKKAWFDETGTIITINGPLFIPWVIYCIVYFMIIVWYILKHYKNAHDVHKTQIYYLFLGVGIMFACLLVFNLILPIFGISYLYPIGGISTLVFIGLAAYAIIAHQLLDIRIIIQRSIIYTVLFALVIGVYTLMLEALELFVRHATDTRAIISAGITMALGVFLIRPLEDYFRKITDRFFFKHHYNYADALHALSQTLSVHTSRSDIVKASSELLASFLKASFVSFRFTDEQNESRASDDARTIIMPISFDNRLIGEISLGSKRSNDPYTLQDKKLLETFTYHAAVALEKGRLFEEVEHYSAHLQELVDVRTEQITQLQKDERQAMIDISHNLQTPIAVLYGELELLDKGNDEQTQKIKHSLDRVSEFIRQLLRLSRLEYNLYTIDTETLDIALLLETHEEYLATMAEDKHIQTTFTYTRNSTVEANAKLLSEVIMNLFVNAINYRNTTKENSYIKVTLSKNTTHVFINIEDNGVGIKSEDLPHIFTRFYRSQSTAISTSGTGLGLAICKTIIEKHNGEIHATSIQGTGTTLKIKIPLSASCR